MSKYEELAAMAAKLSDDDLLAQMDANALALTVLWREAEKREQPEHVGDGSGLVRDVRYGKKLFVQVGLTGRRGFHISAFRGEQIKHG